MVHLDTAQGTTPIPALHLAQNWDGSALDWPANQRLKVDTAVFPSLRSFVGHDLLHGPGDNPFGLDDKLGLTHLMTLAWLLEQNPETPHAPLLLIGRPDEEIGRMEALEGLAELLAQRGVTAGYTVDGIEAFEINVENFNAAGASLIFPTEVTEPEAEVLGVRLVGVNTHGATARAEGHRAATRLAAELLQLCPARVLAFATDPERECDAVLAIECEDLVALRAGLDRIIAPHADRGAAWEERLLPTDFIGDAAFDTALRFVQRFMHSVPGFPLLAEDSEGYQGYSHPYRIHPVSGGAQLDFRLRDFTPEGLTARVDHVVALSEGRANWASQYVNMGPRLAHRPELVAWAKDAAEHLGLDSPLRPIRGGTGVDPFLDAGVAVANLGTGYFAPESEKELTSMQMLADHAKWLLTLVQVAAR